MSANDRNPAADGGTNDRLTVFYDGACPLCRREVAFYRRIDRGGAILWQDVAADGRQIEACGIDRRTALDRIHARRPDGSFATGAAAFVEIWARLPGFRWLAPVARRRPVFAILERAYAWFAPRRHRISRWLARREAA